MNSLDYRRLPLLALILALHVHSGAAAEPQGSLLMTTKQGYVTTDDGVRLFFHTIGNGADVVLVPLGLYLSPDFDRLATGRTLVYYDPRNRGRSDPIDDPAKLADAMRREVDDLDAVRRHVGARTVDLIGHSYAGVVVGLYAMRHPERVRRMVQIGPGSYAYERQYPAELRANDAVSADVFAKVMQLQRQGNPDPEAACRAAWVHLRRLYVFDAADTDKISRWGFCELANERSMLQYFNQYVVPSWRSLDLKAGDFVGAVMPTLVIHGTNDRNAPYGAGRDWAKALPNARLISIERAAHVPWVEAHDLVFDSIERFLGGEWPATAKRVTGDQ